VPADAFALFYLVAETQDFHSVVVQWIWFGKVKNIEFYCMALGGVCTPEKVPLRISICVYVVLQNKVVFWFW
jgi:hypothetical protein